MLCAYLLLVAFLVQVCQGNAQASQCSVKTTTGKCCVFPFNYKGTQYNKCIDDYHKRPWCATTDDYDKDKQWGDCDLVCKVKTEDHKCCVFPFTYKGKQYDQCITSTFSGLWCATTSNYDNDGQWGKCVIVPQPPAQCGKKPGIRIVGGSVAQPGEWPWQAMLMTFYGTQFCGGSLIDPFWVLTAAHCLEGVTTYGISVRLGAHYRKGYVGTEQDFNVQEIIMHPEYNKPKEYSHDIALLRLSRPAMLTKAVGTVCLGEPAISLDSGKRCWISGWGHLSEGGSSPNALHHASVPIVSRLSCTWAYPFQLHSSMLCAGTTSGGEDTCQGDSGGPLVCEFNGRWYLEGVTSWGEGCAAVGTYGVYASTRYHKTWIQNTMSSR
ncbi:CUB and peptidase domain-containing protein 2-like [Actinia tenebrosa]|uniref:CUB and peptidase domain-containing protein 2-like n=1 Tax=Actinia tenebrosa TaxID=6105 RepID=A0A6P8IJI9_ACTTE|nr:CUB and peptidase domain-containing protein 2-like [Actinia tenebrosa]